MNYALIAIVVLAFCGFLPTRSPAQHHGDGAPPVHHENTTPTQGSSGHAHGRGHEQSGANAYMHQSSIEELIQRFESPERDAYQHPGKVLEWLGKIEGKTIIDIGAGTGYFSVKLAERGAKVIAADVDDELLAYLGERISKNDLRNIEVRKVPYDSPGLADGEADVVFLVNTYHHIEGRVEYFAKVRQGMAKGADLVIIDFFATDLPVGPPPTHKIPIDQVLAELRQAGFTTFDLEVDLLPYQFLLRAR